MWWGTDKDTDGTVKARCAASYERFQKTAPVCWEGVEDQERRVKEEVLEMGLKRCSGSQGWELGG